MQKETEKLKKLTQKLRETGDVTEDEADWIYILRRVVQMSYLSEHLSSYSSYIKNNFVPLNYLEEISLAFYEWYEEVYDIAKAGKRGNFLSTVFFNDIYLTNRKEIAVQEQMNEIVYLIYDGVSMHRKTLFRSGNEISFVSSLISEDRCLVSDVSFFPYYKNSPALKLARFGLLSRYSFEKDKTGDTKEGIYLSKLVIKLKHKDITPEEADNVYLLLKYAQTLTVLYKGEKNEEKKKILKKQSDKLFNYLSVWYKTVYEAVKDGRSGNFLTTLPAKQEIHTGKAGIYVKRALKLLPANIDSLYFFNDDTIQAPLISFDIDIVKRNATTKIDSSFRYNGINIDTSGFVIIKKEDEEDKYYKNLTLSWMTFADNDYKYLYVSLFDEKGVPCPGHIAKMEILKRNGVYPVLITKNEGGKNIAYTAIRKEDYDKIRYILDIPDEDIERRSYRAKKSPILSPVRNEEIIKAFEDAVRITQKLACIEHSRDEYVEDIWIPER